jgi:hypothetical protein
VGNLKLFVLGEISSDPSKWDGYGSRALVIAHDATEAEMLVSEISGPALEIPLNAPQLVLFDLGHGDRF